MLTACIWLNVRVNKRGMCRDCICIRTFGARQIFLFSRMEDYMQSLHSSKITTPKTKTLCSNPPICWIKRKLWLKNPRKSLIRSIPDLERIKRLIHLTNESIKRRVLYVIYRGDTPNNKWFSSLSGRFLGAWFWFLILSWKVVFFIRFDEDMFSPFFTAFFLMFGSTQSNGLLQKSATNDILVSGKNH